MADLDAKLARKRPAPIQSGRAPTWAGAVVYALGQVNFLFDSSTRAKQVRDLTKMDYGRRSSCARTWSTRAP